MQDPLEKRSFGVFRAPFHSDWWIYQELFLTIYSPIRRIVNENTDQQRATDAGSGEPEDNQDDHRIAEVPRWAASPVGAQYWTVEDTETDGNHVEELGQGIGHGADGNSIPPDLAAGTERVKVKTGRRLFSAFWPQARGQGGCIVM